MPKSTTMVLRTTQARVMPSVPHPVPLPHPHPPNPRAGLIAMHILILCPCDGVLELLLHCRPSCLLCPAPHDPLTRLLPTLLVSVHRQSLPEIALKPDKKPMYSTFTFRLGLPVIPLGICRNFGSSPVALLSFGRGKCIGLTTR